MPNTTIVFLLCFFGALAASLVHPIWALVAYIVDYYQHPPLRWWGRYLPSGIRWSLMASATLLVALFLRGKLPLGPHTLRHRQIQCLAAYCVIAILVTFTVAVSFDRSTHYLIQLLQLTLLVLVFVSVVERVEHWRLIIVLIAIGGLTWGLDAWIDPERVAGRLQAIGGPDSRNDNSAALHLLASLPFIAVMGFYGKRLERVVALFAFPFVVNTIILCNSRGATVAMAAMGLAGVVLARGKVRFRVAAIGLAGVIATLVLADPQFLERQLTIVSGERDGSTQGRLTSWAGALELMQDYPLGAGGGGFDILSPVYIPEIVAQYDGAERSVHNTYLWIGSDWGIAGLAAFLGYLWFTFRSVHRARKRCEADQRLGMDGLAVQVSLVGVCVGAIFISRSYGEILYWIPALGTAYVNIAEQMLGANAAEASAPVSPAYDGGPAEGRPPFVRPEAARHGRAL